MAEKWEKSVENPIFDPFLNNFGNFSPISLVGPKSIFWPCFFFHFGPEARKGVCTSPMGSQLKAVRAENEQLQQHQTKIEELHRQACQLFPTKAISRSSEADSSEWEPLPPAATSAWRRALHCNTEELWMFRNHRKGGTASLRSRRCVKRNAVFVARFMGLSLYFLHQKGIWHVSNEFGYISDMYPTPYPPVTAPPLWLFQRCCLAPPSCR